MSSAERPSTTTALWLWRGMMAGASFALVENLFAYLGGSNIPPSYFLAVVAFDLLGGLAAGLTLGLISSGLRLDWGRSFSTTFVPLSAGSLFLFFLDKFFIAFDARALPHWSSFLVLLSLVLLSIPFMHFFARTVGRAPNHELSAGVSVLLLHFFLVGCNWISWSVFHSYFTKGALLTHAAFGVLLAAAIAFQDAILRWRVSAVRGLTAARLSCILSGCAAGISILAWAPLPAASVNADRFPDTRETRKPPIILISVDTLRADHLSLYGYQRKTSGALERLASDGVVYLNAISPSTWTLPGHASMLTGTFPRAHSAHFLGEDARDYRTRADQGLEKRSMNVTPFLPLHPNNLTLAEVLSSFGYRTAGIVANSVFLSGALGFEQGFDFYIDSEGRRFGYNPLLNAALQRFPFVYYTLTKPYRLAEEVNAIAFSWLEANSDRPFFLFLNYMEPHYPYCPPIQHQRRFSNDESVRRNRLLATLQSRTNLQKNERQDLVDLYDDEIAYLDHQIGLLMTRLKDMEIYEKSLIILSSDHGEFFGEHQLWSHGIGPYDPVHRVPLIVKYPGNAQRGMEERWVQTVDIFPTVLDAAGIPVPDAVQGHPLHSVGHPIVTEHYPNTALAGNFPDSYTHGYRTLYEHPWKLVAYMDGSVELFHLVNDPEEEHDLSQERGERVEEMRLRLESYIASLTPITSSKNKSFQMDEDLRRRLETLGYVH